MRFRLVYFVFLLACAIYLVPFLSDGPFRAGGFRGGGDNRVISVGERIALHGVTLVVLLFAGYFAVTTFLKDYWTSRGSISQQSYSFALNSTGCYRVSGILGVGPAVFEVVLRLQDRKGKDLEFGMPIVFNCTGTRLQYHQLFLRDGVLEKNCEFDALKKGDWEAEIQVEWPRDDGDDQVCELKIKTYSSANKPVVLPDAEVAT